MEDFFTKVLVLFHKNAKNFSFIGIDLKHCN
jgi:hypothetical protein